MCWGGVSRIEVITPISNRNALLDNDLDTLASALYVSADDLLKSHPEILPWRPRVGIAPRISDAELVTLAVMQALLGFTSERRWLRHVTANLPGMFPCLPAQPSYNKRLRKLAGVMQTVIAHLGKDSGLWSDSVWVADSTPVETGRSVETVHRSDPAVVRIRVLRVLLPLLLGPATALAHHPPWAPDRLCPDRSES